MKNRKTIYILCLIMLITTVSIGYALLTGVLNINGKAKINAATWNIYFKNVKVKDGSVQASVAPAISNKTTVNFEVNLNKPGDFYEFNVDVVNDGDLDAMIESINITPELTTNQQKYLGYSITYVDGVAIEEKDILHAQKSRNLKIIVEYKKNIDNVDLLSSDETLNVHVEIKYVQADSTAKESISLENNLKLINVLSGNGTNPGDEIAIGDEHFYVISNNGANITMLAKYNLLVGNICTSASSSSCTPITDSLGIQDESAKGYDGENIRVGVTQFSETKYWSSSSYGAYVYNDKSSVSKYINNYKTYLESLGANIKEARLIKHEELSKLGTTYENGLFEAPEWSYSTSYWTGSFSYNNNILSIDRNGYYTDHMEYDCDFSRGVRPVIVIPSSSI